MRSRLSGALEWLVSVGRLPAATAATLLLFLFAVELLGTATDAAAPVLEAVFRQFVVGDAAALGVGWFGAYALASGSVVAAIALSLFEAGIVSASELFLLVAGSRLGAAAIVVVVGALDWIGKDRLSLRESVSMGLLTFLLTHSVYLPATVLGYVALPRFVARTWVPGGVSVEFQPLRVFDPVTDGITAALGPALSFLLAVGVLFASLELFDRVLSSVEASTLRRHLFDHFGRRWLAAAVGLLVTTVTTSVAFSLGVVVPLYNRGYVEREELVPYVLGANLGTLFDTVVVAALLGSGVGVRVVLGLLAVATVLTVACLAGFAVYRRLLVVDDRLVADRWAFVGFVASLLLVPLALVVVPLVVVGPP